MATVKPIAVLDTSALVGFGGRQALQIAATRGQFVAYWSPWIIAELIRVLTWRWVTQNGASAAEWRRCSTSAKAMMAFFSESFVIADPKPPYPPAWQGLGDDGDVPIWATAKLVDAQYIVSENTRHFPPRDATGQHTWEGVTYLTTTDFLAQIEGGGQNA